MENINTQNKSNTKTQENLEVDDTIKQIIQATEKIVLI